MNGNEFIRKIEKVGKARGVAVSLDLAHGKGSHGRLFFGAQSTVKDRKKEIGPSLLAAMPRQLGLTIKDIS